ncbi:hypothetical protein G4B84_005689 [Aspergillus flavus NRRL3357]|nr:uncharacterized protein G4B84_005689 [Aspergillus flavus NRRL3357]QMW30354.1 hypothetical protein G4B84_005689 [Aspergillus flavus NRRL3357]QMW42426.1 hypothetical protein G4B11_005750 [Aspergillus flavus]
MSTVARNSFRARACDNCRARKSGGMSRAISKPALKVPLHALEVDYDSSEQRLEALQEQLAVINQTLAQITQSAAPGTTGLVSVPESSTHATLPFEGQSSFHHETLLAKDAALSAIATSHNSGLNDHVSAVLSSLKNSLAEEHLSNNGQPTETNLPSSSPDSKSLLPVDLVVAVVRAVKGLNSYELMADPTIEKIQALLIGIIKAQEEFDIQRCWTYLSLAFNMCQTVGLHRSSTTKGDPSTLAETKRHVFWLLYTIDKNISLNLGFTSHFQDHDIDTDLFTPSDHHQYRSWDLMTLVTAEFATIQGRVYDELYSISASRASDEKRLNAIEKLSVDLIAVRDKLLAIDVSAGLYADSLHGMAACADFITYSVLTVIYRAETRPRNAMAISSRCYEAATLALHSHLKCFTYFRGRQTHKQIEYVHWILLYPSFAPFVIVFTHAITTASNADLSLLQETVKSLDLIKGLSRGSRHLYTICEAFARAAQVLVESQQTLMGLEQHQDGSLVIPSTIDGPANISLPNVPWPEDTFDSTMSQEDISMFLNDFIGANRSVMDILNSNYMSDTLGEQPRT